jgi:phosphohistidine phosphatase SixA
MELILVRHAIAFERDAAVWPDDARRPLTEDGIRDFRRMAKRLGRIAPAVERVESSAFDRAWATAEILRERAGWPKPHRAERLEPGPDHCPGPTPGPHARAAASEASALGCERAQSLARTVAAMRGLRAVAWVGHEPMLSQIASLFLAGSSTAVSIDFRKGAALALRFHLPVGTATPPDASSVIGRAELLWMLTPRMVRRMR